MTTSASKTEVEFANRRGAPARDICQMPAERMRCELDRFKEIGKTCSERGRSASAPLIATLEAITFGSVSRIILHHPLGETNPLSAPLKRFRVRVMRYRTHPPSTISSKHSRTRSRFSRTLFFSTPPLQQTGRADPGNSIKNQSKKHDPAVQED